MNLEPDINIEPAPASRPRRALLPLLTYPPVDVWTRRARLRTEPELPLDLPLAHASGRDR
jgi:hypothetical protein